MFQFINNSYFDKVSLSLPNTDPSKGEGSVLRQFILDEQVSYLEILLGNKMAYDFISGISSVTDTTPTADAKWLNLLFGKKILNGEMVEGWLGFSNHHVYSVNVGSERRISPYANYIYCKWVEQKYTTTMGQGEALAKHENSVNATSYQKLMKANNKMVDLHYKMHNFIISNIADYPDYIGIEYPPVTDVSLITNSNQYLFIKQNSLSI